MPNFRHLLFLALLFLPLASWSQTTEEEFNYANGGYLKLQELGYGTKPNYQLVEAPVGIAPGQEGPVTVLALVREANEKTAAAILTTTDQNGQTQVRWVICEPRSVWSLEKKSFENQTLFPKSTDSSTLAFTYRMFQKALWPDRSEGAENRVTNYTNDRIEEAQITDFEVPKSSFYLPGRNNIELPLPSDDCKSEGTVVVKIFVNREGDVVYAQAGVNIPNGPRSDYNFNSCLLLVAKEAATQSKWEPDPNSITKSQQGYIVYRF